jgi:hypothetical protein
MTDANKSISSPRSPSAPSAPLDSERLKQALSIGLKTLKDSGSKAAAARAIYDLIHMESRENQSHFTQSWPIALFNQ